jgi:4,5:9,10-diseco-3-hydroxy-5,9,17-trioxoandrosta-1(10),2-diene-4-oate hydrolase
MAIAAEHQIAAQNDGYGPPRDSAWRRIDWRSHLHWVLVDGEPVNYVDIGSGPPLLLIHGLAGSWQNWLETIPHFARTHRVVAPDLPGFGESPMPREKISIAGYGRQVDAFCDEVGIERAAVVGNSMGGFVAAEVAIQHPHRVEKLVLVSAAGITIEHQRNDRLLALMRRFEFALTWAATHPRPEFMLRRRARHAARFVFAHPDRIPGPLLTENVRGSGKPGFVDALDALTSYPLRDRLERISVPTLVVWGDSDRLVPTSDADVFEDLIPNARKVVYEDTGHVPQLERPGRFNADVEAFLRS